MAEEITEPRMGTAHLAAAMEVLSRRIDEEVADQYKAAARHHLSALWELLEVYRPDRQVWALVAMDFEARSTAVIIAEDIDPIYGIGVLGVGQKVLADGN